MNEGVISIRGVTEGILLIVILIFHCRCRLLVMVGWRIVSSNRFEMRVLWKVHLLGNGTMTFGERREELARTAHAKREAVAVEPFAIVTFPAVVGYEALPYSAADQSTTMAEN